jgi:PST family polysaccharide transporter
MRAKAASGAVLTGAAQIYRTGINFVSSVFLARQLTPADFGLIAMVSTCVGLVAVIQDLGLNQAIIQRRTISKAQVSALFWLSLGFGLLLAVTLALSAPGIAWFYSESRLTPLTVAFAFLLVLGSTQSQLLALLNREFRIKALAAIDVLTATVGAIVGVTIAWLTASYWALFMSSLASIATSVACAWLMCSFRPGVPSFEGNFREMISFGSGVSGFNFANYFARNADNVLIGRFYGSEPLGLYDRAYRLLLFPLSQILSPLGRVLLPLLARLQSEPERYRKAYIEAITLLMLATQPGLVFSIIFAKDVFSILLGSQWTAAVPIFQWLGVAGLSQVMTSTLSWLFLSQGRGSDFFQIGLFSSLTTIASFVLGLPWGPQGVAVAYTINNYAILVPAMLWSSGRRGPVSTYNLVNAVIPHLVATAVTALTMISIWRVTTLPSLLGCAGLVTLCYSVYGLVLMLFPEKRSILLENLRMLNSFFAVIFVTRIARHPSPVDHDNAKAPPRRSEESQKARSAERHNELRQ